MAYELQVYALSPRIPTPRELMARASASGFLVESAEPLPDSLGDAAPESAEWGCLRVRPVDAASECTVELSSRLDEMKALFRSELEEGESIPEQVLEASRLYVLTLEDDEDDEDEAGQAALVVTAWGLATSTEGIVFDPQEEFFADAESFWALLMDEDAEVEGTERAGSEQRGLGVVTETGEPSVSRAERESGGRHDR